MKNNFISIVNRNLERLRIMEKIDRDLRYARFAKRLNRISARRKK